LRAYRDRAGRTALSNHGSFRNGKADFKFQEELAGELGTKFHFFNTLKSTNILLFLGFPESNCSGMVLQGLPTSKDPTATYYGGIDIRLDLVPHYQTTTRKKSLRMEDEATTKTRPSSKSGAEFDGVRTRREITADKRYGSLCEPLPSFRWKLMRHSLWRTGITLP
jgi:hypothetical protein